MDFCLEEQGISVNIQAQEPRSVPRPMLLPSREALECCSTLTLLKHYRFHPFTTPLLHCSNTPANRRLDSYGLEATLTVAERETH
jgi:hypothetical protein